MVGTGRADARTWASTAKAYVGRVGPEAIQDCVQLHGGIGVTYDLHLHLYLRRALVDARRLGTIDDSRTRDLIGEGQILALVTRALVESVSRRMAAGALPHHAAAMGRLFSGTATSRRAAIATELCADTGVVWAPHEEVGAQVARGYLARQAACIGGGTTEMARNVISERLLGMPREQRADTGAFRDVPRGPQASGAP